MLLHEYHRKAIELKYKGNTLTEISKALGDKIAVSTLGHLFSTKGLLYAPYKDYCAKMESVTIEQAKESLANTVKQDLEGLEEIIRQAFGTGDMKLAFEAIRFRLAINGINETKKLQIMEEKKYNTYDELIEDLAREGIDIHTGLSLKASELLQKDALRN